MSHTFTIKIDSVSSLMEGITEYNKILSTLTDSLDKQKLHLSQSAYASYTVLKLDNQTNSRVGVISSHLEAPKQLFNNIQYLFSSTGFYSALDIKNKILHISYSPSKETYKQWLLKEFRILTPTVKGQKWPCVIYRTVPTNTYAVDVYNLQTLKTGEGPLSPQLESIPFPELNNKYIYSLNVSTPLEL